MSTQQQVRLADGRRLAYADIGPPDGAPVLYCHGVPSSRAECELTVNPTTVSELKLRIIAPDRPGMGGSDFLPGRRIVDWPGDVLQLLDALRIDRCAVLGSSGGAPYALVCGAFIPERVPAVGLMGCQAPPDAPGIATFGSRVFGAVAQHAPPLVRALLRLQMAGTRGEKNRARMAEWFPEPDRTLLQDRQLRDAFIACFEEACRPGFKGVAHELGLTSRSWGFDLQAIDVPVLLWQGERDRNVAETHGRYLARTIPHCQATFYPEDAHLSTPRNHHREIFTAIQRTFDSDALRDGGGTLARAAAPGS